MAQYLGQHPEVFVVRGEPHFFGSDIDYNPRRLTRSQYLKICGLSAGKPVVGERSTWYLYSERAAEEIHSFNPEARIIAMLRNPVEMVHSLHRHHFQRGRRDDLEHLADALTAEPDRRRGRRIPPNARFTSSLFYTEIPRYSEQLQRYFDRFGRERVHVILFDDLKRDPAATFRDTLRFLGVDHSFKTDFAVHNVGGPTPDHLLYRLWKATTLRYRIRSAVPSRLYDAIRKRRRRQLSQRADRRPRPRLDRDSLRLLERQFAGEIERLEALLGRDLSAWRKAPPAAA
jgi:hypothetical protein